MVKQYLFWFFGSTLFLIFVGVLLYRPVILSWHTRWGASGAEVLAVLVGDEIVRGTVDQTTRAIDIHIPAEQVWPWLLQMGQGRGGMYSYDWLENLAGCDMHTLNTIEPALQILKVGDRIMMGPQTGLPYYQVVLIAPEKSLVLRSINPANQEPGETWGFYLVPQNRSLTRLIIRHRTPLGQNKTERLVNAFFDPIVFIMERQMVFGLREHAERY